MRCQFATGVCDPYKNAIISNNVSVPVSSNTGLAAAIFQQDQGYRVTYEDARGTIRQLAYANTTSGLLYQWEDGKAIGGLTSSDSHALSYTWTPYVPAQSQDTTVFQALNGTIRSVTSKIQLASTWAESGDGTWVNCKPSLPNARVKPPVGDRICPAASTFNNSYFYETLAFRGS